MVNIGGVTSKGLVLGHDLLRLEIQVDVCRVHLILKQFGRRLTDSSQKFGGAWAPV